MNVIGIVGRKNSGKTTMTTALIRGLSERGYRVSSIKHAHHGVDFDQPGTDSFRHRDAGAGEVILASGKRFAVMHELRGAPEPNLNHLLERLAPADWVVVEGFKKQNHDKIEVHRDACLEPPLFPNDPGIIAVAADHDVDFKGPSFDLNDIDAVVDFVLNRGCNEATA